MTRSHAIAAIAALAAVAVASPALAAPPTVTPSPGYDARLQESQSSASTATPPQFAPDPQRRTIRRHRQPTRQD